MQQLKALAATLVAAAVWPSSAWAQQAPPAPGAPSPATTYPAQPIPVTDPATGQVAPPPLPPSPPAWYPPGSYPPGSYPPAQVPAPAPYQPQPGSYPPPPGYTPPPPVPPPEAAEPWEHGFFMRAAAGYSWQQIIDIPAHGFDVNFQFGGSSRYIGGYGFLETWIGNTENGLNLRQIRWGGGVEGIVGRVRFGPELSMSYFDIDRATAPADDFQAVTWGIAAKVTVDLYHFDPRGAFFVGARIGVDGFASGDDGKGINSAWGPTVTGGFRF